MNEHSRVKKGRRVVACPQGFVVFDMLSYSQNDHESKWHGHLRSWEELPLAMKITLIEAGQATVDGERIVHE